MKQFFVIMFFLLKPIQAESEIRATIDQSRISLNETVTLKIIAKESDDFPKLDLSSMEDFTVISGPAQSSSFQWINGKMSSSKTLSWTLIPNKTGTLTIPSFSVEGGAKIITTEPIKVIVIKEKTLSSPDGGVPSSDKQVQSPLLFLVAETDKKVAFQGEQLTVHYKLYTRANLRQYAIELKPKSVGFWQEELYAPKQPTLRETSIDGIEYRVATIYKVALFPITSGELELEPMMLNCSIEVPSRNRQFSLFNDFFSDPFFSKTKQQIVRSDKLQIEVKPVPEPGKPADFSGAVGTFEITSAVDTSEVIVNQALSYKVELSGTGNLGLFQLPELEFPGGLEVFSPKTTVQKDPFRDQISGTRSWEYILIPRRDGQYILPQVKLSYLEPNSAEWRTTVTQRIPIVVKPAQITIANGGGLTKEEISLLSQDIRYIRPEAVKIRSGSNGMVPIGFWYMNLIAVLLFLTPNIVVRVENSRQKRSGFARKRGALRSAKKSLRKVESENFEAVEQAIYAYFSDRLDISEIGLDARILRKKLSGVADDDSINILGEILSQCGFGRFSQSSKNISASELAYKSIKFLTDMDRQL